MLHLPQRQGPKLSNNDGDLGVQMIAFTPPTETRMSESGSARKPLRRDLNDLQDISTLAF